MLTFAATRDAALIRSVIVHPAIFPHMFSDGGPTPDQFQPVIEDRVHYVTVSETGAVLGLFIFVPQTSVCWEAHACLLPAARGKKAIAAYKAGIAWLGANTPCKKLIGFTPATNKAAIYVALRAGFEVIGVNKASILLDGELRDQMILGVSING